MSSSIENIGEVKAAETSAPSPDTNAVNHDAMHEDDVESQDTTELFSSHDDAVEVLAECILRLEDGFACGEVQRVDTAGVKVEFIIGQDQQSHYEITFP